MLTKEQIDDLATFNWGTVTEKQLELHFVDDSSEKAGEDGYDEEGFNESFRMQVIPVVVKNSSVKKEFKFDIIDRNLNRYGELLDGDADKPSLLMLHVHLNQKNNTYELYCEAWSENPETCKRLPTAWGEIMIGYCAA